MARAIKYYREWGNVPDSNISISAEVYPKRGNKKITGYEASISIDGGSDRNINVNVAEAQHLIKQLEAAIADVPRITEETRKRTEAYQAERAKRAAKENN